MAPRICQHRVRVPLIEGKKHIPIGGSGVSPGDNLDEKGRAICSAAKGKTRPGNDWGDRRH